MRVVMSLIAIALACAIFLAARNGDGALARSARPQHIACGDERWTIKTLADADANSISLTTVRKTTIEALRRLKTPAALSKLTPRIAPTEKTVFQVDALLMSMKLEGDDDIHMVIADPVVGGSMIVEFPGAGCVSTVSTVGASLMSKAKAALAAACGPLPTTSKFVTLQGRATIDGVGFFDFLHHQGGVAPNGIELHPVLRINVSACRRVP
jgi:hypothetical protein